MAIFDSVDLLARTKKMAKRPAVDEAMSDPEWYGLLDEAQKHWVREIAAHVPEAQYGPPTQLVTSDSGETYQFPDLVNPGGSPAVNFVTVFGAEIYTAKDGSPMRPGGYWEPNADYVFEMDKIRFPNGDLRTFTNGPFARYVQEPGTLDASTEPVLRPPSARALLVPRACAIWATMGGYLDPSPYYEYENRIYYGDPGRGIVGILASLKSGDMFGGAQAYADSGAGWWYGIDVGGWVP